MSTRQPRFEVVHSGPRAFHARFRAANGEIVWTTETYKRRRDALHAVDVLTTAAVGAAATPPNIRDLDER
jgi:uncharacterized protein YegP (UPF0339 family)